jgi:RES domain-containing protein
LNRRSTAPLPPVFRLHRNNTHRLIPAKFGGPQEPLKEIAATPNELKDLLDLASATDEIRLTERGLLPAVSQHELASGVPHARIINAAFVYAHLAGSRFNGADRGAWYAAFQLTTAQAEVAFHKTVQLAEIGRFEDAVEFDDYRADFNCEFHDLRRTHRFASSLDPTSYVAAQTLAEKLLERGSCGVIYPSVRRERGTCLACFDPKSVLNVRRGQRLRLVWSGKPTPRILRVTSTRRRRPPGPSKPK